MDFDKGTNVDFQEKLNNFTKQLREDGINYETATKRSAESRYVDKDKRKNLVADLTRTSLQHGQAESNFHHTLQEGIKRDADFHGITKEKYLESTTHKSEHGEHVNLSDVESTAKTISELAKDARKNKLFDLKKRDAELKYKIDNEPADSQLVLHAITERESIAKRIESLEIADKIDALKDKLESAKNAKEKAKLEKEDLALQNGFRDLNGNFSNR